MHSRWSIMKSRYASRKQLPNLIMPRLQTDQPIISSTRTIYRRITRFSEQLRSHSRFSQILTNHRTTHSNLWLRKVSKTCKQCLMERLHSPPHNQIICNSQILVLPRIRPLVQHPKKSSRIPTRLTRSARDWPLLRRRSISQQCLTMTQSWVVKWVRAQITTLLEFFTHLVALG